MAENAVPRRQYTKEFKVEAVRLAESAGQHEAARRLGVPVATLGNWCRGQRDGGAQATAGPAPAAPSSSRRPVSDLEAEVSRLRKELASAKLDIEILRKATAYFAKGSR
ncbi:transposase (plasmid) [Burkholderia cenocepacia]|nr:transposase [Burkholderia cenocepacia]ALV61573.1 transposase [Burkholderia cenocepacia]VWC37239.1 transposase IS3/IS911 family protein [Burkholderia metallica]